MDCQLTKSIDSLLVRLREVFLAHNYYVAVIARIFAKVFTKRVRGGAAT